jgi:hypothetical protein
MFYKHTFLYVQTCVLLKDTFKLSQLLVARICKQFSPQISANTFTLLFHQLLHININNTMPATLKYMQLVDCKSILYSFITANNKSFKYNVKIYAIGGLQECSFITANNK